MTETKQPGTEIDAALWAEFREEVKRRRGGTRGHLRNELENAIRGYIHGGDVTPGDVDQRLQRIEAAVGAAPTDGGTDTFDTAEHTHALEDERITEKPAANCATEKKVAYLATCVVDREVTDGEKISEVPRDHLREIVVDEFGFRSDTAKRYVERLTDHFDLRQHPIADPILVTKEREKEILDQRREQTEKELDET